MSLFCFIIRFIASADDTVITVLIVGVLVRMGVVYSTKQERRHGQQPNREKAEGARMKDGEREEKHRSTRMHAYIYIYIRACAVAIEAEAI
jgi:hypothetical protein